MQNGILPLLTRNVKTNFSLYSFVFVFFIASVNFFSFIWTNTANILYWDQWDIVNEVVKENNWLNLIFFQHNEHKMGLGLIITKILEAATSWNNHAETLFIGLILFVCAVLAVLIKRKLFGKIEIYDIFIPILFFNLYQWENLIWGFQISFVLPLLMLFLSVYLYTFKVSFFRNFYLIFISILSIFTHFHGLIVVFLNTTFFILSFLNSKDRRVKQTNFFLVLSNILIGLFYFYRFEFSQTYPNGSEPLIMSLAKRGLYIVFEINQLFGLKITNSFNVSNILVGLTLPIFPIIVGVAFFFLLRKSWVEKSLLKYFPIVSLFIFSFAFCIFTAFGRSGFGLSQAFSSRYTTFIIPMYLGVFLTLYLTPKIIVRKHFITFLVSIFFLLLLINSRVSINKAKDHFANLSQWKVCYLKNFDPNSCSKITNFSPYPDIENINFKNKLTLLKLNKLNIWR